VTKMKFKLYYVPGGKITGVWLRPERGSETEELALQWMLEYGPTAPNEVTQLWSLKGGGLTGLCVGVLNDCIALLWTDKGSPRLLNLLLILLRYFAIVGTHAIRFLYFSFAAAVAFSSLLSQYFCTFSRYLAFPNLRAR
jgi:hypothetical protein